MRSFGKFFIIALGCAKIMATLAFGPMQKLSIRQGHGTKRHSAGGATTALRMGMKVNIRIVGRKSGGEKWLDEAYSVYEKRLRSSSLEVETSWHKDNFALVKAVETDNGKGHSVVLLDPLGKSQTSEKFSEEMYNWLDKGGSRLVLVIGGAEGLPFELKEGSPGIPPPVLLSLSALTFTHQFARLLLIEQIYRASEIRKGSGYHK
jgi:23S rRNA (pseudouridine1915-N3)-methyltransferase